MTETNDKKTGWKQKMVRELVEYWVIFVYLACFFGVFTWYRRLILMAYQITYLNYGVAIVEALVLAKVIMIGDMIHLGRHRFESKPLYVPTLYRTFIFTIFVGIFSVLEHLLKGFVDGKRSIEVLRELFGGAGKFDVLARCLIMFFAFIPFFAGREMARVLGKGKITNLFFRKGTLD